ncbi:hypothetical protein GCM10009584_01130 [Ornithinimicrobium humiphilum]|uniref:DUF1648 domain-containing protein n=1 Tax=Ornithinimicrobium humiphilum TaxID=125288 RepID=A0A543KRH8_9MICO|nr:hypothetical protein [Ornithinimicrobium humiphilum]TQM97679.1 hypothetical protein FB476_2602 [Ornithinimicrobium humiphilum]
MNPRRALSGLLAIAPLAVLLVVVVLLPPPARVPTHWSGGGPDAWAAGPSFLSGVLTVTVLSAIAAAATAVLQRAVPQAWSRWIVTAGAAVGWGAVVVYVVTVWRARLDGPDAVDEAWVLLALLAAVIGGAGAYAVHGRRVPSAAELRERIPDRARTQPVRGRAVGPVEPWSTEVSSTTLRVIGWGMLVVFLAVVTLMVTMGESLAFVALVVVAVGGAAVLALSWSAVRLSVDADGLQVRSRVAPVRLTRIAAEDVAGVEVLDLDPMAWGGIGLRVLPERTAYIANGGPGIVVWKRDGRRLALQVTEGDAAARAGARTLLQAAGQRLGETSGSV